MKVIPERDSWAEPGHAELDLRRISGLSRLRNLFFPFSPGVFGVMSHETTSIVAGHQLSLFRRSRPSSRSAFGCTGRPSIIQHAAYLPYRLCITLHNSHRLLQKARRLSIMSPRADALFLTCEISGGIVGYLAVLGSSLCSRACLHPPVWWEMLGSIMCLKIKQGLVESGMLKMELNHNAEPEKGALFSHF